eukprot:2227013-Prymnesium_polylepis.1
MFWDSPTRHSSGSHLARRTPRPRAWPMKPAQPSKASAPPRRRTSPRGVPRDQAKAGSAAAGGKGVPLKLPVQRQPSRSPAELRAGSPSTALPAPALLPDSNRRQARGKPPQSVNKPGANRSRPSNLHQQPARAAEVSSKSQCKAAGSPATASGTAVQRTTPKGADAAGAGGASRQGSSVQVLAVGRDASVELREEFMRKREAARTLQRRFRKKHFIRSIQRVYERSV